MDEGIDQGSPLPAAVHHQGLELDGVIRDLLLEAGGLRPTDTASGTLCTLRENHHTSRGVEDEVRGSLEWEPAE